jgi:hypothetical protein
LIDFTSQQDRRLHLNVGLVTAGAGHRSHPFHFVVSPERSLLEAELRRELQVGDDEIAGGDMPPFCWKKLSSTGKDCFTGEKMETLEFSSRNIWITRYACVSRIESHV